MYYNRARYYNPETWRFISRDPIDIVDDINLYAYVGNNPIGFVDLMGTEKSIILLWEDKEWSNLLSISAQYQIDKLIDEWILSKNIIIAYDILTPWDINNELSKYEWNINEIIFITHWSSERMWLNSEINKDNISEINNINSSSTEMTLISCNTWKWVDSIANDLSNQLWINVVAPTNYIFINSMPESNSTISQKIVGTWIFANLKVLWIEEWEPNLLFWIWKFKTFNPK